MKTIVTLALLAFVPGCASLQVGSDFSAGRRALLRGDNNTALSYFQSAAQTDANYRYGTAYRQGVLSYVGRTQYALGNLPQAKETLERALSAHRDEDLSRLYLGLTYARSGDRQRGLTEIEGGMRGINDWLDWVTQAHRFSYGQYWDSSREIRSAIQSDLTMLSARDVDVQRLIDRGEWLGKRMEEELDHAQRAESRERSRDGDGKGSPR